MDNREKVLMLTRTAISIALLIVVQAVTAPLGNTLITGSLVNMILIISVMLNGLGSGLTVAILSPVFAKFFGIGPLWSLIPFIAVGNAVLVLLWYLIGNGQWVQRQVAYIIALIVAAVAKFLVLYLGIVKIAVPILLELPEKQAAVISNMFSVPQLITASIGGVLAFIILPILKLALKRR